MRALLDINVLIALFDADHVHHAEATRWLKQNIEHGWASCPLTQNGCVRIMSQPRYPNALSVADVLVKLQKAVSTPYHKFIADNISLLDADIINREWLLSPRQLTDIYLLALATENDCCFVTFDKSISLAAVKRTASTSLVII